MSVLAQATGRGDVLLVRGVANEWAVLWEQSADGVTFAPVNLAGYTGTLELRSPLGDLWLSIPAIPALSGETVLRLTPAHLSAPEWAARTGGSWVVNLTTPAGTIERLGAGYFALEA